jgi:hypothetical protein
VSWANLLRRCYYAFGPNEHESCISEFTRARAMKIRHRAADLSNELPYVHVSEAACVQKRTQPVAATNSVGLGNLVLKTVFAIWGIRGQNYFKLCCCTSRRFHKLSSSNGKAVQNYTDLNHVIYF